MSNPNPNPNPHPHQVATGPECGFVETITDAISLDALKRKHPECATLSSMLHPLACYAP